MGRVSHFVSFLLLLIGYQESVFQTFSYIIYKNRVKFGKCFERFIVSLVSYKVSRAILSNLFLYNL